MSRKGKAISANIFLTLLAWFPRYLLTAAILSVFVTLAQTLFLALPLPGLDYTGSIGVIYLFNVMAFTVAITAVAVIVVPLCLLALVVGSIIWSYWRK